MGAADITTCFQSIDQANGAMVSQEQTVRQFADTCSSTARKTANGEQHLVLLRLEASGVGGAVAAAEKLANAIAELRECNVFGIVYRSPHKGKYIALRYKSKREITAPVASWYAKYASNKIKGFGNV